MYKFILSCSLLFIFASSFALSANGNFSGSVCSANTGNPLKEYEIEIEGTYRRLHIADLDGRFGFAQLDAGEYLVSIIAEGYKKYVSRINISAGKEVRYLFFIAKEDTKQKPSSLYLGELTISGFSTELTPELLRNIPQDPAQPVHELSFLVPYANNIVIDQNGTNLGLFVPQYFNGTNFTDPFNGNTTSRTPTPSLLGLSGVSVSTLYEEPNQKNELYSFDMEPNRGKENGFDMFFRVGFGLPSLNGCMNNDIRIKQVGSDNELEYTDGGPKLLGRGEFSFEYGISGALPGANKGSTFALSIRNYSQDHNYGLDVYDAAGNNLGAMPNQSSMIRNVNTQFKIVLDHRTRVYAEGMFAATSSENSSNLWLYATNKQTVQTGKSTAIERQMKQNAENIQYDRVAAAIEFDLPSAMSLRLGLARNGYEYKFGRRSNGDDPSWTTGYDMYAPEDKYEPKPNYNYKNDTLVRGNNLIIDNYEHMYLDSKSEDKFALLSIPLANPLTGFDEISYESSTKNPYGFTNDLLNSNTDPRGNNSYYTCGQEGLQYQKMENYSGDLSFIKQFELFGTKNKFTAIFDFSYSILKKFLTSDPSSKRPQYDAYSDEWDVDYIYAKDHSAGENRSPILSNFTLTDKFEYRGLTVQPMLKLTYFDPGHKDSTQLGISILKNETNFEISPSVFVAYRVSDATNVSATAGIYHTALPFDFYLSGANNSIIGNPTLGLMSQKHVSLSIDQLLLDRLSVRASVFKSWYQYPIIAMNIDLFQPDYYINSDKSDNMGVSLQTVYRLNNNLSFFFMGSVTRFDLESDDISPIYANAMLTYSLGRFEGLSIGEFYPFAGMSISLAASANGSGYYVERDRRGRIHGEYDYHKCPTQYSIDLRLSKMFYFADLFPSLTGGSGIEVAFDVLNLLDFTKPIRYNMITDDPDKTYILNQTTSSTVGTRTYYKTADFSNAVSFSSDQYDGAGRRLYNAAADFNNDGKVTPEESYKAFMNYYETELRQRTNYQLPRRVFMSVTLKF